VARCGRWGQVVGTLAKLEDDSETSFCTAILHLEDGTQLHALYAARHMWAPFLGRTVTVVSRIEPDAAAGETGVVLTGWYAICSGVVCRCGM